MLVQIPYQEKRSAVIVQKHEEHGPYIVSLSVVVVVELELRNHEQLASGMSKKNKPNERTTGDTEGKADHAQRKGEEDGEEKTSG